MLALDATWRTVTTPRQRRPRVVVVDEALLLLSHPAGAAFLLRLAKAARKHWCAIGAAFAAHTAHNHLRRRRLRRPRAVMNQRRFLGGQLWSVPELAALAHLVGFTRPADSTQSHPG